jgi:lysyl-tRNA synthetase class 2
MSCSLDVLQRRAQLLAGLREYFHDGGYWEVETPLLSRDSCVDAWLDPFEVHTPEVRFLQTSPEFCMKRLLAQGADSIYQLTRSFRAGEFGDRHNPEFTIIEWYRVGISYHQQMDFVEGLVRHLASHPAAVPELTARLPSPIPRLSYDAAFERATGKRVLPLTDAELAEWAAGYSLQQTGQPIPAGLADQRDNLLNYLLAMFVEPSLAEQGACFLYDFPASQAALAQIRPDSPPVAERFELYLGELEICNGYQELTDPAELRQRQQRQNELRVQAGKAPIPTENRLLAALEAGYPPSSGVALGFDRLVMWLLQQPTIQQVLAFPWPAA